MKETLRRILSKTMAAFMALSMMAVTPVNMGGVAVWANTLETPCDLWVGGHQAHANAEGGYYTVDTSSNGGTAVYEGGTASGVLTLTNYHYEGTGYDLAAICSHLSTLTIRLIGENVIKHTSVDGDTLSYGIFSDASQTTIESINGTGSLEVRGGDNIESCGIYCSQLTVNSGHITAVGGDGTNGGINSYGIRVISRLKVTGGTINALGGNGAGCWSRGITFGNSILSGGTITAVGGDASGTGGGRSFGLTGVTTVTGNAVVEAIGGDAYQFSYGMTTDGGGPIAINGGTVTCSAGEVVTGKSCGVMGGNASAGQGLSISEKITSFVSSGNDIAIDSDNITNAIAGTGWTDVDGTEGRTEIAVNTTGAALDFKKVQFPTAPKKMTASANGFSGKYDGKAHGIKVEVTEPESGYTIKYGEKKGTYDKEASPEYTEVGSYTVYYKVTADGYEDFEGQAVVEIKDKDDPSHTHSPKKHDRVEATEDKEGNIEYWECEECGKLFKDEACTEEIELKDTVIPKKEHEITPSENKAMDVKAENIEGGYVATYAHQIPFPGKGKLTAESFGDNFTVTQGDKTYKVKKIKVNKKKKKIQVTDLEGADKPTIKAVKKATKGDKGLDYKQNPYYVRDADNNVTYKFKKSGSLAWVKVKINDKDYKAKKDEYEYTEASKLITFKGDNLAGSWIVKP